MKYLINTMYFVNLTNRIFTENDVMMYNVTAHEVVKYTTNQ